MGVGYQDCLVAPCIGPRCGPPLWRPTDDGELDPLSRADVAVHDRSSVETVPELDQRFATSCPVGVDLLAAGDGVQGHVQRRLARYCLVSVAFEGEDRQ